MKRRERALIVFIALILFWGTIISTPFKYFAWMTRDVGKFAFDRLGINGNAGIFVAYVISIICMIALFIICKSGSKVFVSAICSIASLIFFIITDFAKLDAVPLSIVIGITLSLFAVIIKTNSFEAFLADLFILSIPVMILYDALLVPIFSYLKINTEIFAPWIIISKTSYFSGVTFFSWPSIFWGLILTAIAFVPAIYFVNSNSGSKSRAK